MHERKQVVKMGKGHKKKGGEKNRKKINANGEKGGGGGKGRET